MRNVIVYITSALSLVLGIAFVVAFLSLGDSQTQIDELREKNAALQAYIDLDRPSGTEAQRTELETEKRKLAEAEDHIASLTSELSAIQDSIETEQASTDPESQTDKKKPTPPFMRMMESDEAVEAGANMQVNMQYGILFADLKLPSEVEDEVRAILADSMKEQIRASVKAMQDGTMEDFRANHSDEATADALRTELCKVLNADEMAVWEDYEENKQYYMLQQSYDMQLGMYAPSMPQETRDTVKQVMAEEMTLAQPDRTAAGNAGGGDWMTAQTGAMDRSLERLSTVLNDEEYAQVERFIQQQNEAMQASQRMMQSMMGTEDEEDGAE
jgi:hypothetical protein